MQSLFKNTIFNKNKVAISLKHIIVFIVILVALLSTSFANINLTKSTNNLILNTNNSIQSTNNLILNTNNLVQNTNNINQTSRLTAYKQSPVYNSQETEQEIFKILKDFINSNKDRKAFTAGEKSASEYIYNKLTLEYGFDPTQVIKQEFSREFTISQGNFFNPPETEVRYSQNIVLQIKGADSTKKIVIGTQYDNRYTDNNHGVLDNGSGVAILLSLAKQFLITATPFTLPILLPYDVDIVFFGGGNYNFLGSEEYILQSGLSNVILMSDIYRIGGGESYFYSDEVSTIFGNYISQKGLKNLPKNVPVLNAAANSKIPYAHIGLLGNHSAFMSRGVTVANIFGAYFAPLSLLDSEGEKRIGSHDNIDTVEKYYPNAAAKMANVYEVMFSTITDANLHDILQNSINDRADYSIFLKPWIAYIVLAALMAVLFVILILTGKHFENKYRPIPPKRLKVAVFGIEYEQKDNDTVYIDTKNFIKNNYNNPFGK